MGRNSEQHFTIVCVIEPSEGVYPGPGQGPTIQKISREHKSFQYLHLLRSSLLLFISKIMSDSLWPHELQHTRLPYPSLYPWVCSNSCPLSLWCHPTISSSVALFSYPQSFPASGSFPMSWLFASGGQGNEKQHSLPNKVVQPLQSWFGSEIIFRFGYEPNPLLWTNFRGLVYSQNMY